MEERFCWAELAGLFASLVGHTCSLVAIIIPQWLTLSAGLLVNENYMLGLWESCVIQDVGTTVCKGYDSVLDLPTDLQIARILMCLSIAVGCVGLGFCIPSMHCVNSLCVGGSSRKRKMAVLGGFLLLLAGVLTLVPVSFMAHITLVKFWDSTVPDVKPRWEFGNAMFSGFAGGFLLVAGGVLLVKSRLCICSCRERSTFQGVDLKPGFSSKTEYV